MIQNQLQALFIFHGATWDSFGGTKGTRKRLFSLTPSISVVFVGFDHHENRLLRMRGGISSARIGGRSLEFQAKQTGPIKVAIPRKVRSVIMERVSAEFHITAVKIIKQFYDICLERSVGISVYKMLFFYLFDYLI